MALSFILKAVNYFFVSFSWLFESNKCTCTKERKGMEIEDGEKSELDVSGKSGEREPGSFWGAYC